MNEKLYENSAKTAPLPKAFVERRLHSLTGFFLVLFLFEHLLVNSQAALFFGEDGSGFINAVNSIQSLPYLPVIEISLLGVPIVLHGWWGLQYLRGAQYNSMKSNGTTPSLNDLPRNHAYTWQRITSVILVVGILLHVGYMRFLKYPETIKEVQKTTYIVRVHNDPGLASLSKRLGVVLRDPQLQDGKVLVETDSFGTAVLLSVRDAFQSVFVCILYTIFVAAACFHAMNGVWTFAISWGVALSERSRCIVRRISNWIMYLIFFFGLMAIWGTYFTS